MAAHLVTFGSKGKCKLRREGALAHAALPESTSSLCFTCLSRWEMAARSGSGPLGALWHSA